MKALDRHEKAVLQFSGGKDSLATLYLCKPWWDKITVAWVNTGSAFPETLELMAKIRALVPNFVEVRSRQPEQIEREGWPVDVLPIKSTPLGLAAYGNGVKLQSFLSCCTENIWLPMQEFVNHCGATLVIRGQRNDETPKSPIRSGHIENGIEYLFPVEDWTAEHVLEYLGDNAPQYYKELTGHTSLDCHNCTAFTNEPARYSYTKANHPELWSQLKPRLELIHHITQRELDPLRKLICRNP